MVPGHRQHRILQAYENLQNLAPGGCEDVHVPQNLLKVHQERLIVLDCHPHPYKAAVLSWEFRYVVDICQGPLQPLCVDLAPHARVDAHQKWGGERIALQQGQYTLYSSRYCPRAQLLQQRPGCQVPVPLQELAVQLHFGETFFPPLGDGNVSPQAGRFRNQAQSGDAFRSVHRDVLKLGKVVGEGTSLVQTGKEFTVQTPKGHLPVCRGSQQRGDTARHEADVSDAIIMYTVVAHHGGLGC
mmetsp:Transcript_145111/g.253107  ORF Transcript_145111/g.253107 Transcript_145111/m.253107 type:complete len:242 (+) Transcript_145111:739-1464(+)